MLATALKKASYEDLYSIPDNMIGQIIDGELFAMPRPSFRHSNTVGGITDEIKSLSKGEEADPAAGLFYTNRKSALAGIFLFPICPDGKRKDSRNRLNKTIQRFRRTGSAKSCLPALSVLTESKRCGFMPNSEFLMYGLLIRLPKCWRFSVWNPADGYCCPLTVTMTLSAQNRFMKSKLLWKIFGGSKT